MTVETSCRSAFSPRPPLFGLIAAWRSWHRRQVTRRALETMSNHLLKDIGLRRLPAGPSPIER